MVLGARIEAALEARLGSGVSDQLVVAALETADLGELAELMRPLASDDERLVKRRVTVLDPVEVRRGILGSVADAFLRDLPRRRTSCRTGCANTTTRNWSAWWPTPPGRPSTPPGITIDGPSSRQ